MTHFAFFDCLLDLLLDELSPLSLFPEVEFSCSFSISLLLLLPLPLILLVLCCIMAVPGSTLVLVLGAVPFFEMKASITDPLVVEFLDVLPDSESSRMTDGGLSSALLIALCGAILLFLRNCVSGESVVDVLGVVMGVVMGVVLVEAILRISNPGLELRRSLSSSSKFGFDGEVWRNCVLGVTTIAHLLYVTNDGLRRTSSFRTLIDGDGSPSTVTTGNSLDESESLGTNTKCDLRLLDGGSTK